MNKDAIGKIYIANPKESFDWLVYVKPLTIDSWCAVVLFILIVPVIMVTIVIIKLMAEVRPWVEFNVGGKYKVSRGRFPNEVIEKENAHSSQPTR